MNVYLSLSISSLWSNELHLNNQGATVRKGEFGKKALYNLETGTETETETGNCDCDWELGLGHDILIIISVNIRKRST
ncbi:hypothetical protein DID88_006868 [Monilinia fructigena]|uniref:Uncharacterized protein n=1 Tax=Monilinia fructigena TaxID=38457 RepID=A0A395ILW7_9HELO|nr:hypothetical protein DID88_006868 [Monilinia fructigena]